ncbi:MAG: AAA family ATPase [Pseudomonadota bacterium]
MYLEFFGLHERPFTITPDPRYLFMSERHAEALAHLIYGVTESDGFIVLTGEVGTGKTTLVRSLLQRMPEAADVALVLNPQLTALEFLTVILKELDLALPEAPEERTSCRALTEKLNEYLLEAHARGRRTIAVVDEAQNLSAEVLEQIRLLTNLETTRHKLLQIVLIGQPELRDLLARADLRQLAQRITARYHLLPLNAGEADRYLEHRLAVAGALQPILNAGAKKRIHGLSHGIPRLMNLITDRALLGAWSREQRQVDVRLVDAAAEEVFGAEPELRVPVARSSDRIIAAAVGVIAVGITIIAAAMLWPDATNEVTEVATTQTAAQTTPAAAAPNNEPVAPAEIRDINTEATPVTTREAAPEPSLHDWLQAHRDRTGTADAFAALFAAWQLPAPGDTGRCEAAARVGLRCAADQGALAELLLLDRPAIITLRDLQGEAHQVLLAAQRGGDVMLRASDANVVVPRAALDRFWFGEYLLLWKPAAPDASSFAPGMRGAGILWLRQSLAALSGEASPGVEGADRYDSELASQVRDYQRSRRLTVDGLVGQKTQMMINTDLGVAGIPRLSAGWPVAQSAAAGGSD